mgnify:CR=1 FL=1
MKNFFLLLVLSIFVSSCSTVKVATDYDSEVNFNQYKSYAFYKPGIDKADISDLDKKRILRAIESEMNAKGYTKSSNPDILVSIFTKSREKVNINQSNNFYGYFGYRPWFNNLNRDVNVSQYTEGTLFIDFIDKQKKELVWQGIGTGALKMGSKEKKDERIKEFVKEIISKYPPMPEK